MHSRGLTSTRDWNIVLFLFKILYFLHFTNTICGRSIFSITFCNKIRVYGRDVFSCPAYSSNNIYTCDFGEVWYRYLVIKTTSLLSANYINFVIKFGFTVGTCSHALHIHPITYIHVILVRFDTDILSSETTSLLSANYINFLPQVTPDWGHVNFGSARNITADITMRHRNFIWF